MSLETSTTELHEKFYIPEIKKLEFNLPRERILGTHHCGKEYHEALKRLGVLKGDMCQRYYTEHVVSSFPHKIQSE